jgi:hypothetical protein
MLYTAIANSGRPKAFTFGAFTARDALRPSVIDVGRLIASSAKTVLPAIFCTFCRVVQLLPDLLPDVKRAKPFQPHIKELVQM